MSANTGRSRGAVRVMAEIVAGAAMLLTASGCIATRSWVHGQLDPLAAQLGRQESRLSETDAKANRALAGLHDLHLERRLVLSSPRATFASGSAALSERAKRKVDGFLQEVDEGPSSNSGSASERVFIVAGYTDSIGPQYYNYELGQRRAERVAGYLVEEGIDPSRIRVVSYGESKPIASNSTPHGRRSNRRVEILVYQEQIVTGS